MKGLSILFTVVLLWVGHHMGARMSRKGKLPAQNNPHPPGVPTNVATGAPALYDTYRL